MFADMAEPLVGVEAARRQVSLPAGGEDESSTFLLFSDINSGGLEKGKHLLDCVFVDDIAATFVPVKPFLNERGDRFHLLPFGLVDETGVIAVPKP
jgi:hypothetical protein